MSEIQETTSPQTNLETCPKIEVSLPLHIYIKNLIISIRPDKDKDIDNWLRFAQVRLELLKGRILAFLVEAIQVSGILINFHENIVPYSSIQITLSVLSLLKIWII